ncbi:hypothetical protein [Streptomyces sp. MH60]|uniref:hypothetical protein n=1 Tax=Streptomyces sp. MH60 TaxID=1940758 RepID=UPI000CEF285A|nr:hypothetical protein [Streptomyces sp. MH60]PPS89589.1 hypothetical protein BZZ08_01736 [Streptomyces sp. MH60]
MGKKLSEPMIRTIRTAYETGADAEGRFEVAPGSANPRTVEALKSRGMAELGEVVTVRDYETRKPVRTVTRTYLTADAVALVREMNGETAEESPAVVDRVKAAEAHAATLITDDGERFRPVEHIAPGWQIRQADGSWKTVEKTNVRNGPNCVVRVDFTDGATDDLPTHTEAYSRMHAPADVSPIELEPVMYTRMTGAYGIGWALRVCDDNRASVRDAIARARKRGNDVTVWDNGVIQVNGAGKIHHSYNDAGKPCPVWFLPQRPAAEEPPAAGNECDECGEAIPDTAASMANPHHAQTCSLYEESPAADGHRALMEAGHAQLGALAKKWSAAVDAATAPAADKGMPSGAHRITNTGESIEGGTAYAFTCSRCDQRATLVGFDSLKCTPTAERDHARERADGLLSDVTFEGATAYALTSPDRFSGEPSTRTVLRGEAREALALWLDAGAPHTWGRGELRVRCFQGDHTIQPVVTAGAVIRTGADVVELSREPWRGGQVCGHQTQYGMGAYSERYCGKRKAPGLVECREHYDDTLSNYGPRALRQAIASGVAVGDPSAPVVLLWEPYEGDVPEEPTEEERAAYAAATGAPAAVEDPATPADAPASASILDVSEHAAGALAEDVTPHRDRLTVRVVRGMDDNVTTEERAFVVGMVACLMRAGARYTRTDESLVLRHDDETVTVSLAA